ncbi:hypothetical protein BC832DRAFT_95391 [Gaertneriomyces semiglobifer]|nr:hypothetical protein BC832DRAFT_95391 [Gaertneriomyces semiglobifer]
MIAHWGTGAGCLWASQLTSACEKWASKDPCNCNPASSRVTPRSSAVLTCSRKQLRPRAHAPTPCVERNIIGTTTVNSSVGRMAAADAADPLVHIDTSTKTSTGAPDSAISLDTRSEPIRERSPAKDVPARTPSRERKPGKKQEKSSDAKGDRKRGAKKKTGADSHADGRKTPKLMENAILESDEVENAAAEVGTVQEVGVESDKEEENVVEVDDMSWLTDLETEDIVNKKNTTDPYIAACIDLGIIPVSSIHSRLNDAEISVPHFGIGENGAKALAVVLKKNSSVKKLDLTDNWIGVGGGVLVQSLQINRVLRELNLSGNHIDADGGREIAEMLQFNMTLEVLNLSNNQLGDREAQSLAEGLRQNSTLKVLDLSHNQFGCIGAMALGAGLSGNDGLRELNMGWNMIRGKGMAGLLAGLRDHPALTHLNLEWNGLGENGQYVSAFLMKNNIIQALNLRRTRCNDVGIAAIAKSLEQNCEFFTASEFTMS